MTPPSCPNCLRVHVQFTDHCLLELIGAVLVERGDHTPAQVQRLLAHVSPDALWERMAELIDAVQYGELDRE